MAGRLFAISGRIPTGALASGGLVAAILDRLNERDCLRRTSADQLKPVSTGTVKLPLSVPLACDEALQDLALLIDGPPEMVSPSVDLHEESGRRLRQRPDFTRSTRRFRISAANIGPNLYRQLQTASWLSSTPRAYRRPSTFRNESGNQT